jgi:hypothetical protein
MHGGLSTGPRTEEGRRRLSELGRARYLEHVVAGNPELELWEARIAAWQRTTGCTRARARFLLRRGWLPPMGG